MNKLSNYKIRNYEKIKSYDFLFNFISDKHLG